MVDLKYSFYTRMRSALIVSDRLNTEDSYSIIVIISMFCKIYLVYSLLHEALWKGVVLLLYGAPF